MPTLRNPNRSSYTCIPNGAIKDDKLSLKAKGLLASLLSLPDNWNFSEKGLEAIFVKDGQASIRSGLKELETSGYLSRKRIRDSHGKVVEIEWTVSDYPLAAQPHLENPLVENPHLDNPNLENPNLENQPQLNTKESSTEEPITKESIYKPERQANSRFEKPTVEEVKSYCESRGNNVDPEAFVAHYESNGWMVGKVKMKSWKSAVITWEKQNRQYSKSQSKKPVRTNGNGKAWGDPDYYTINTEVGF